MPSSIFRSCRRSLRAGHLLAVDVPAAASGGGQRADMERKAPVSKAKFSCPDCGANAWGKPDLHLVCGDCRVRMLSGHCR
jgi:hypothetical protein